MLKRLFDIVVAGMGLILSSPVLLPVMYLVRRQDGQSPFYVAPRVGVDGSEFRMVKLRSMVVGADTSGVDSTGASDTRITPIGHFIRRYKLDELTQLWNVLVGDMSLVGPRPNVKRETDLYTDQERRLLGVKPGITDLASIVFSDEGEILEYEDDPDLAYNQLIRPWKSRLGLIYIEHSNLLLDVRLLYLTAVAIIDRERALTGVTRILEGMSVEHTVIAVSRRCDRLEPHPPPGSEVVVTTR